MQIVARDYSLNEMKQKQIDDLIEAARYVPVMERISFNRDESFFHCLWRIISSCFICAVSMFAVEYLWRARMRCCQ